MGPQCDDVEGREPWKGGQRHAHLRAELVATEGKGRRYMRRRGQAIPRGPQGSAEEKRQGAAGAKKVKLGAGEGEVVGETEGTGDTKKAAGAIEKKKKGHAGVEK